MATSTPSKRNAAVVADTVTTTGNVTVGGDLIVSGTTTTLNTETITLADNIIVLNSNATGAATENAGIEIERGSDTNVSLLWDEANNRWTVGSNSFVAGSFIGNASTASKWASARTNTVALTGDVTGTGSASVDGSNNWTVTVNTVVANDSHSHSNYVLKTGDTMTGNLTFSDDQEGIVWSRNTDSASIKFYNTSDGDTDSRLEFNIADNTNEDFRFTYTTGATTTELLRMMPDGGQNGITFRGNIVWHAGNFTPSNYYSKTDADGRYVLKTGDSMTGVLSFQSGETDGIQIGDTKIRNPSTTNDDLIFTSNSLRIGGVASGWNYDEWAAIQYNHTAKSIRIGGARAKKTNWAHNQTTDIADTKVELLGVNALHLGERALNGETGRFFFVEGDTQSNGEGSGRWMFTEHNSTSAGADLYGISFYYEGDTSSVLPSGFQGNTGNATWSLRRHDNSLDGVAIMSGDRTSSDVSFSSKVSSPYLSLSDTTTYGTANGQSHYQWEGATYRNPADWNARQVIRIHHDAVGDNGHFPSLVLYNESGVLNSTVGMSFASREADGAGNAVPLAGLQATKTLTGNAGAWSSGSLTMYVKDLGTRRNVMTANSDGTATFFNNIYFADSGTAKRGIQGTCGTNDFWYIGGGATGSNAGYLEIATGDDGQSSGAAEPIYVRQYGPGAPLTGTLHRSMSLLDQNGNTIIPGGLHQSETHYPNVRWGAANTTTGAVLITLPGTSSQYDMLNLEITVYEYNSTAGSTIKVSGHNWTTGWANSHVEVQGGYNKPVYLGRDANNYFIQLGDTNSSWVYGTVHVTRVTTATYYNVIDWSTGWAINQVTTEPTYLQKSLSLTLATSATLRTPGTLTASNANISSSVKIGGEVVLQESTDRADLLQITSTTSTWGGLQIRNSSNEGRWSFMTDGEAAGIYNDEDEKWHIYMVENTTRGCTAIGGTTIDANYSLSMNGGGIRMYNSSVDYASQVHFNDNVRFYQDGNDSYLNFKFGDTATGGIRFQTGSGTQCGYVYSDGTAANFGLLNRDGQWAVRTTNVQTSLYYDGTEKTYTTTGGLTVNAGGTTTTDLVVDSGGHANVIIDRPSTSYDNNLLFRTNGSLKWRIWQDAADNILQIRNEALSTNVVTFTDTKTAFADDVSVTGLLTATQKSFTIDHPTKEGHKLRYGSLEGPENGVYVRGKTSTNVIELPEYWTQLVHEDSITVSLTPVGSFQNLYVEKIEDNKVYIKNKSWVSNKVEAFYVIYGERKDVEKLIVEFKA